MLIQSVATTSPFRTAFAETVFQHKYAQGRDDRWDLLAERLVDAVCGTDGGTKDPLLPKSERDALVELITNMWFIPGGRYLYYAGRDFKAYNNCFMLRAEMDTREEWAAVCQRAMSCLATGGGIGIDYSILRPRNAPLRRTGGKASGPIPLMQAVNEIGRNVMQGGSRRSAIYASLNWQHEDAADFLVAKNWDSIPVGQTGYTLADLKQQDFNFPAPLDMTNISLNYDDAWLHDPQRATHPTFLKNVEQALRTGEPGFSFNFAEKSDETLRNACCELVSADDSDVCNLGSVNLSRIPTIEALRMVTELATKFLVCGTLRADLPYAKVYEIREKNRRLGLGLMGMHEWLLQRGYRYEVTPELHTWLAVWRDTSDTVADRFCDALSISRPKGKRAVAPTGTIGSIAGTTTGSEPLFAVAYMRRYLVDGTRWHYQYVVDSMAQTLIDQGIDPDKIESAVDLAADVERRIAFQADVQDYVDHAISSTINLPAWNTPLNNPDRVQDFAATLSKYAPRLRGFTAYPDGARGGQPLVPVPYHEAKAHQGLVFEDNDSCKGGVCGL
jgi:ribonucleoside-diphosphate reductase alpha chain